MKYISNKIIHFFQETCFMIIVTQKTQKMHKPNLEIILHFNFSLQILLDFVFDLFIKAQTLFLYMISNIYSYDINKKLKI